MRPPWIHSIAPGFEPETSAPRPMDWKAAQGWCNFILMHPEVLPDRPTCGTLQICLVIP